MKMWHSCRAGSLFAPVEKKETIIAVTQMPVLYDCLTSSEKAKADDQGEIQCSWMKIHTTVKGRGGCLLYIILVNIHTAEKVLAQQ